MAARQLRCYECGTTFYGRADAHYCGAACRQKAHRARTRRRAADEGTGPASRDPVAQARHARAEARAARQRAAATRSAASATRAAIGGRETDAAP